MRNFRILLLAAGVAITTAAIGAPAPCTVDFADLIAGKKWTVMHRKATWSDSKHAAVHLDEGKGGGFALVDGCRFTTGTIELDLRGRDLAQKSFIGVIFHANRDEAAEIVYFRPFNFNAPDAEHHGHAVQYVSDPESSWKKLRTEHPGVYENAITPHVDAGAWFHVRVVVTARTVTVFVNGHSSPTLKVDRLSLRNDGSAGIFAGDDSDGDYANLTIRPDR